jgi:hypothetical protein
VVFLKPGRIDQRGKRLALLLFLSVGTIVGYFNFRFGLRNIFIMTDNDGVRTVIRILGGYLSLLPLTLIGTKFKRTSAVLLITGTVCAFVAGLFPIDLGAMVYMVGRFVLPNVAVASLILLSADNARQQITASTR